MRKLFLICSLITIHCSLTYGQNWLWGKGEVSGASEIGIDKSVVTNNKGDVFFTGSFWDTVHFGSYTLTGEGLFLVKYDSSGNVVWAKQSIPNSKLSGSDGAAVALDKYGNIYVVGNIHDTVTFDTVQLISNSKGEDFCLIKYDSMGNVIWAKQSVTASRFSSGYGVSLIVDDSLNIYVTGNYHDTVYIGSDTLKDKMGIINMFLIKYSSAGNVGWVRQAREVPFSDDVEGTSLSVDNDGNVYVGGYFGKDVSFGKDTLSGDGTFIVKYDRSGNDMWAKRGVVGNVYVSHVSIDKANGIYLGNVGGSDTILLKYNKSGSLLWAKKCSLYASCYSITCDTLKRGGGDLVLSNYNNSLWLPPVVFGTDTFNLITPYHNETVLLQFDSSGSVICATVFNEGGEDDCDGVSVSPSGRYVYLAGDLDNTTIFAQDTLPANGDQAFVARWQPCVISPNTSLASENNESCVFIPTAFSPNNDGQNDILYVRGACIKTMDFVIYDRWGNKVFESESMNDGWDGTYKGQPENTGTYVWYLKAIMQDGSTVEKKGNVALIR